MLRMLFLFAACILLAGNFLAGADSPAADELDVPLEGILRRQADVAVTNSNGIYWADLERKEWQKLILPPEMPTGGEFGIVPEGSPQILYSTIRRSKSNQEKTHGIYGSSDAGQTWTLLSKKDNCWPVIMLENGSLFAVTNANQSDGPAQIELSRDMGKTWRDITGKSFGGVWRLFPDPDHPGLICLEVNSIRNYILQAADENYEWKATRSGDWHSKRAEKIPFGRSYSTSENGNPLYMFSATLRNYFEYDFGNRDQIPAIDLRADQERFTFRGGEKVVVPITVRFLEDMRIREWYRKRDLTQGRGGGELTPTVEKIIDHPTNLGLWGLRVEFRGERSFTRRAAYESEPGWKSAEFSAATPYRRVLDIGSLYDFSQPGEYRVQLDYESTWQGRRSNGDWVGTFSSPVFTTTIVPGE